MSSAKAIIVAGALIAAGIMFGLMSQPDARTHDERVYLDAGQQKLWVIDPATKQIYLCRSGGGIKRCTDSGTHP